MWRLQIFKNILLYVFKIRNFYLKWDYNDPEWAVVGVAAHAFEWIFVRVAPFAFLGSFAGIILTRKKM